MIFSVAIYMLTGYVQAKNNFENLAFPSGAFVGFVDATLGYFICIKLKANFGERIIKWEPKNQLGMTVLVTLLGAVLAWVGGKIG